MPFLFGTNFKMHQTPSETAAYIDELLAFPPPPNAQLFLIPPFTSLTTAATHLHGSDIWLGAQNMHWAEEGAYTGEISAPMLLATGANLVMLGHAERRHQFGETDGILYKKLWRAINAGLQVLLCVGEDADQRGRNISKEVLALQMKVALGDLHTDALNSIMIAYEPVWSIGVGGIPASPEIVAEMHNWIRAVLIDMFDIEAMNVPILYGGSVNPKNCADYAGLSQVDGLFVGRAALTPMGFMDVLSRSLEARS
ncbi:MAG: triose-phosphate isomerase [Chloroflexota bacterium]